MADDRLVTIRDKIALFKNIRKRALADKAAMKKSLAERQKQKSVKEKTIALYDYIIQRKYDDVVKLFEDTITAGLKDVFTEDMEFKFIIDKRGNATTVDFGYSDATFEGYKDIAMTQGKSLKEVVSILLRLVIISLDDRMPKFILLDEQLGGVEADRRTAVINLLKKVSDVFGIKLIVITHIDEYKLMCDNVIKLKPVHPA